MKRKLSIFFSMHSSFVTPGRFGYIDNRMKTTSPTPDAILQTAFGFWNSKVLLTAVTFDLFSTLGQRRRTGPEIGKELDLHPHGVADFLDALVAMKFLERERDGADAKYFNTPATAR
jgi:DNA-binding MarR family transcriptional regulator